MEHDSVVNCWIRKDGSVTVSRLRTIIQHEAVRVGTGRQGRKETRGLSTMVMTKGAEDEGK